MKEINRKFRDYIMGLEKYEQTYFRRRIEKSCGVSSATVSQWMNGNTEIRPIYKKTINETLGVEVF